MKNHRSSRHYSEISCHNLFRLKHFCIFDFLTCYCLTSKTATWLIKNSLEFCFFLSHCHELKNFIGTFYSLVSFLSIFHKQRPDWLKNFIYLVLCFFPHLFHSINKKLCGSFLILSLSVSFHWWQTDTLKNFIFQFYYFLVTGPLGSRYLTRERRGWAERAE